MDTNNLIIIIAVLFNIILSVIFFWLGKNTIKPIKESNDKFLQERQKLIKENENLQWKNTLQNKELASSLKQFEVLQERKNEIENNIKVQESMAIDRANALYENKCNELKYKYSQDEEKLKIKYNELVSNKNQIEEELESLKKTRAAAIAAAQQEKIISENKDDYCLILPPQDQGDVEILRNIIKKISKPRSILMAIWQAYYQPIAKKKFPQILGTTNEVCGIYKITNQQTGECYIGQAKDCRKRWYEHCRFGIGIDSPQGNQLYAAMLEYGLDSFSFELLLECKPEELNEKEKYFISLYNSDALGYNISRGVN